MASMRKPSESKVPQKVARKKSSTSKVPAHPGKKPSIAGVAAGTKAGGGARETTTATTKRVAAPQATKSEAKTAKRTGEDGAAETTRHSMKASKVTKASKAAPGAPVAASNIRKQSQAGKSKRKSDAAENAPKKPDGEAASKVRQVKASTGVSGKNAAAASTSDTGADKKAGVEPEVTGAEDTAPKDRRRSGAMSDNSFPGGKRPPVRNRRKSIMVIPFAKVFRSKVFRKSLRRHGTGDESESSLSSKGQLSLVMVAMLGAFFFCFMVALLVYYFISGPNIPIAVACISDECLKARDYLNRLLNDSKKPCTDFYGHVCDSWKSTSSSFHADLFSKELSLLNASLFEDIRITQDDEKRYGIHVLRPVYRSCYRYMSEPVQLKDALKEAHELLEITELMNAATFFAVVRYLVRQVMQIGVFTLFNAMFVYENGRTVLFMSRGYSLKDKLTVPFGTTEARSRFEQILRYWLRRENVTADLDLLAAMDDKVNAIFQSPASKEEQKPFQAVVSGMVAGVSPEQWLLAIKGTHRESLVLELTDTIIVEGNDLFRQAMQMVVDHGLKKAAFYLATNLEADVVYILSMQGKIAQSEAAKAFYCLQFTYKCLTLTWAYLAARYLAAAPSIAVLLDILAAIQDNIDGSEDTFTWMEKSTTRKKTAEELHKVSLHVIAGRRFNASNVDYNRPDVKLDEGQKFLKVLAAALRLHHSVMAANPPTRLELLISELEFKGILSYVSSVNYVVVPTLYQRDPYLYIYDVPDYFNYGTMGALLGVQLAEIAAVGVKDQRQSTWDNWSLNKHGEMLQCLLRRRKLLGFPSFNPTTADKQQTHLLTLSVGARLAYSGLKNAFRRKSRTVKVFNDYWPEALRVFFTRFCLLWCSGSGKADPLTPRAKCILPLYNIEEFGELYECDVNSTGGPFCPT